MISRRTPGYFIGVAASRINKSRTVTHPSDKWTLLENVIPAIISEELFRQANAQLDKPELRTGWSKYEYLLREHAFCGICGKPLVGHCLNRKYRYYQCSYARPYENHGKKCSALYIRADDLEDIVWSKTHNVLSNPDLILGQLIVQPLSYAVSHLPQPSK